MIVALVTGLLVATVAAPFIAFWAWMFADMLRNDRLPPRSRTTWLLLFCAGNVFGALLYYCTVFRTR